MTKEHAVLRANGQLRLVRGYTLWKTLKENNGNKARSAKIAGLPRSTVQRFCKDTKLDDELNWLHYELDLEIKELRRELKVLQALYDLCSRRE